MRHNDKPLPPPEDRGSRQHRPAIFSYGTVFLPTSLHQLLYRLSRDNLKHFHLPDLSHHFKLLSHICVPCRYLGYATLISTFYYYYYYYYGYDDSWSVHSLPGVDTRHVLIWQIYYVLRRRGVHIAVMLPVDACWLMFTQMLLQAAEPRRTACDDIEDVGAALRRRYWLLTSLRRVAIATGASSFCRLLQTDDVVLCRRVFERYQVEFSLAQVPRKWLRSRRIDLFTLSEWMCSCSGGQRICALVKWSPCCDHLVGLCQFQAVMWSYLHPVKSPMNRMTFYVVFGSLFHNGCGRVELLQTLHIPCLFHTDVRSYT